MKVILPRPPRDGESPAHELTYEWWAWPLESQASFGVTHFPDHFMEQDYLARLREGQSVFKIIDQVLPPLHAQFERVGMQSMGIVPIMVDSEYAGAIAFDDCVERRVFSSGEMDALGIIGHALGAAIYRRSTQARDARQAAELSSANAALTAALGKIETHATQLQLANDAIRTTALRLAAEPSLDAFLGVLLCEIARALGTHTASLMLHAPETDALSLAAVVHAGRVTTVDSLPRFVRAADFRGWALQRESPSLHILDVEHDHALHWPGAAAYMRSLGCTASVTLPIQSGAATIGMMSFAYTEVPPFNEVQRATIQVFCHQAALALQLTRLAHRARSAAAERAVVDERNRMAGEIHDSLAQSFTSIALQSEAVIADLDEHSPLRATLQLIEDTARLGLAEARSSVLALRPVGDRVGELQVALEQLAARCNIAGSVMCEFRTRTKPCPLPPDIRDAVLRVAQEAVNNALRHAGAQRLVIEFDVQDGEARLAVTDDGSGLPSSRGTRRGGFGLEGMRARAEALGGTLRIIGGPGERGTSVHMTVPQDIKPAVSP